MYCRSARHDHFYGAKGTTVTSKCALAQGTQRSRCNHTPSTLLPESRVAAVAVLKRTRTSCAPLRDCSQRRCCRTRRRVVPPKDQWLEPPTILEPSWQTVAVLGAGSVARPVQRRIDFESVSATIKNQFRHTTGLWCNLEASRSVPLFCTPPWLLFPIGSTLSCQLSFTGSNVSLGASQKDGTLAHLICLISHGRALYLRILVQSFAEADGLPAGCSLLFQVFPAWASTGSR
ncbi:hypothetical protein EK21DRAFT_91421 [Setomelanomma holmii]|uniref:Uncharacterized protein n=1 Tax=Setomelanomma holmii TaxID=210430 RepID=A0A9P4H6D9_9PLEO|nr:hypothetical protein EK21DRAFT_91421 [Setomelanomma holmii]